jgi:hypothetical protein
MKSILSPINEHKLIGTNDWRHYLGLGSIALLKRQYCPVIKRE